MSSDLISVIVPSYNVSTYILSRSAKLLDQTYSNIEFIFIDDCSTDNTWDVLQELQKNNNSKDIKIYRNETNLGVAITRNNALKLANGKYIYFADADDIADPTLLEKAYALLQKDRSEMVIFAYEYVDKKGSHKKPIKKEILSAKSIEELRNQAIHFSYNPWTKLISKDFLIKNEITFPDIRFGEDMCWTIKIMQHIQKISFLNEYLYKYIATENSLSSGKHSKFIIDCFNINKDTLKNFTNNGVLLHDLKINLIETYLDYFKIISHEQKVALAKAFFALPEIKALTDSINNFSIWERYPFYKLILIKSISLRSKLKSQHADYKKIKEALSTKSYIS